jgi:hypothetical protein
VHRVERYTASKTRYSAILIPLVGNFNNVSFASRTFFAVRTVARAPALAMCKLLLQNSSRLPHRCTTSAPELPVVKPNRDRVGTQRFLLLFERKQSQFQTGGNSDFVENVGQVMFHREFADPEVPRDLFIGVACDHRRDNL